MSGDQRPSGVPTLSGRQPHAIQSSLRLLEVVAQDGAGVTAKQIAHRLSMPPATVYRLANILVAEEYLVRLPGLSGFALGARVGIIADAGKAPRVVQAAKDLMADLRLGLRVGVHLCRCAPGRVRYLDTDPDFPPPVTDTALSRRLAEPGSSAVGRLLAGDAAVEHGSDDPEPGCDSVAVAVRDPDGVLHACLWIVGSPDQVRRLEGLLEASTAAARTLDRLLR